MRLLAVLVWVCATVPLDAADRAREAVPVGGRDSFFAWTLGAHAGVPLGMSMSVSAIIGHADASGVSGLVLRGEPGIGGGKLGIGYAAISGRRQGPYLMRTWQNWAPSSRFLWAHRGWSARGVLMRSWGGSLTVDSGRSYAGAEGELIGSFAEDRPWGGLHGLSATLGVLANIDSKGRGRSGKRDDIGPGDELVLILSAGVGF
ncbi:MAG: hypothetical protein H0V44_10940 [Planctomycetes bacterium]|nr:hypothetical protein [Planctomycetota bacterium]